MKPVFLAYLSGKGRIVSRGRGGKAPLASFGQNWCGEGSDVTTSLSTQTPRHAGRYCLTDEAEDDDDEDEAGSTDEGTEENYDDERGEEK